MALKISVREAFEWFCGKAKEFALSPIPDAERVAIVIERMEQDTNAKRRSYKEALARVIAIQDPDHPDDGRLPDTKETITRLEKKGEAWGADFRNGATTAEQKQRLRVQLEALDRECTRLQSEVSSLERELALRQETLELRRKSYKTADAELKKLRALAPAIVEQTNALQDAQRDRMDALKVSADRGEDAGVILGELQKALDEADAGNKAAATIEEEESDVDVHAIIAAEDAAVATSERMQRWTRQSS